MAKVDLKFWIVLCILILISKFEFIYSSKRSDEQQKDKVSALPGQNFLVNFSQYAGYVTVNEEQGKEFFYWFVEASENPSSKPLTLWLNGGPGCSAIAFGEAEEIGPFHINPDGNSVYLNPYAWNQGPGCSAIAFGEAEEIGPFHINPDGNSVYLNPYAWNQVANIIFLDTPVGVGFSYANSSFDLSNQGDQSTAEDNLVFLLKWLERFPQYKQREFYIMGESYAGHFVPQLSKVILQYNSENEDNSINLKGFMIGNALVDDHYDTYFVPMIHTLKPQMSVTMLKMLLTKKLEILIITKAEIGSPKDGCYEVNHKWKDSVRSVLPTIKELNGIRKWVISGDTDAVIPITSTRYSIDALQLPTIGPWRAWNDDGQVGGWTQQYDGLTFVTVKGGGHEIPLHKPKQALAIFKSFLAGQQMPSFDEQLSSDI